MQLGDRQIKKSCNASPGRCLEIARKFIRVIGWFAFFFFHAPLRGDGACLGNVGTCPVPRFGVRIISRETLRLVICCADRKKSYKRVFEVKHWPTVKTCLMTDF